MDKQKADKIITEYLQKIYGFAVKKSFSYDEAEDLCDDIIQEVYLSLLKANEIVNIEGYIWRISEHTYSKYVSSKKRMEGISIDSVEIPFFEDFTVEDAEDDIARLRREVAFLTEKRRRIIYLFYYKNRSISYISKSLGIPEGTVKWHLNKAKIELKEGFSMERKIGKLGLAPIEAISFGHDGNPGRNGGLEFYLGDKLNLNIVYSVYHSPKTKDEIAEELGVTLVYIEDRIDFLEGNGYLVKTAGGRYTTYVVFTPETYSAEFDEKRLKKQLEVAEILAKEYVPAVRKAVADMNDVYIPGGNRELLEAAAIFYGVGNKCQIHAADKDLSPYIIKTTDGGSYFARVHLKSERSDPEYEPTLKLPSYWVCGGMYRFSEKYPAVYSWSADSRLSSREGAWKNNPLSDYEYLYEYMNGSIRDDAANAEKFSRLRERKFITEKGDVNIMVVKGASSDFFDKIPSLDESIKDRFADFALEIAMADAKNYPPQMQDMIISRNVGDFIGQAAAIMLMDILYTNGTLKPLTENEKVTSNLIMFSDILPKQGE